MTYNITTYKDKTNLYQPAYINLYQAREVEVDNRLLEAFS